MGRVFFYSFSVCLPTSKSISVFSVLLPFEPGGRSLAGDPAGARKIPLAYSLMGIHPDQSGISSYFLLLTSYFLSFSFSLSLCAYVVIFYQLISSIPKGYFIENIYREEYDE